LSAICTEHLIAVAEKLIAGLIRNPRLVPVVVSTGLTDAHFPRGVGLQAPFRFAVAGPECVERHVASNYEDLSHTVLRRLAKSPMTLTVAEARTLAHYLLDPGPDRGELAVRAEAKCTAKDQAIEFLRRALADGGMLVTELEARARIAGLLKPGQPIGQCKPFRDAKRKLGIKSDRKGFGRTARYHWRLPVHG
jgi:hypothetical protein